MNFGFEVLSDSKVQIVFQLMACVIFFGAVTWATNLLRVETMSAYQKWFVDRPQRRRDKEFMLKVSRQGKLLVYNSEKGIGAVCFFDDFFSALKDEREKVAKEQNEDKKLKLLLSPFYVMPRVIFTFASSSDGLTALITAGQWELEDLLGSYLERVTGFSRKEISSKTFQAGIERLIRKDKRLVVPMMREGHLPNGDLMLSLKDQAGLYGNYDFEQFQIMFAQRLNG